MTNYIILLPPSEGKKEGGLGKTFSKTRTKKELNYFQELEKTRQELYFFIESHLNTLLEKDLEKLFEVKKQHLEKALLNFRNLNDAQTLASIERFDGVMFKAINYESLDEEKKKSFSSSVLFIDALFGLLKPLDLIPNYKLKIGSKIDERNLDKFWKEKLKDSLKREAEGKIVIDLLPEAHRKVLDEESFEELIQITFLEEKQGKIKQAGHLSKQLKAEIIHYLLQKEYLDEAYIKDFTHSEGYAFSKEYSKLDSKKKIFTFLKK